MGYYTRYKFVVPEEHSHLIDKLRAFSDSAHYCLDERGNTTDSTRWYEHEEEMRQFSGCYPDVVMTLSGEGERAGDMWAKHFKGGKVHVCEARIAFDDFDESKLV